MEVIPAIDLIDGAVVRLLQGDFDRVTEYESDPVALARRYAESGCRRLHVVDLDGAKSGTQRNMAVIEQMAACGIEVQSGGGIRDLDRLRTVLDSGVRRAVIGSVAVTDPERVTEWLAAIGAAQIILAFDVQLSAAGVPEVLTHGWTENSHQPLWPLIERYSALGAREFLCTDISKDGMLTGPNVELYRACTSRFPEAEFIASGGVSGLQDLYALNETGVTRAVTGKALLDGRLTLEEIQTFSRAA